MKWRIKSGFSVEAFERSQSRSRRLADYLAIYIQNFAPLHRTKTNELLDFLENPDEGRIVVYFGLSYSGKPCGFATLMFYPGANVGIIDHLAISPTNRGYGAFFSFCELIAEYLEQHKFICNYLLAEIVLSDEPISTGTTPLTLIRLTRFVGFRIANLPYYAPDPLIITNKESCRAALMIITQPDKPSIEADELIELLRVIYFKHYAAWYERVMSAELFSEYKTAITKSFVSLSDYARSEKRIKINGMKNFDMPYVLEPASELNIGIVGYATLFALPAILTIIVAFEHDTVVTAASIIGTAILFTLMLIPKFRNPLLKFFQLKR